MKANTEQLAAITDPAANLLIVAGPGSGKTFTLVERIIAKIEAGTHPARIVVITFTNAAAQELQRRLVDRLKNPVASRIGFIGTLHAFCLVLLRGRLGFRDGLTVLDEVEEKAFVDLLRAQLAPRSKLTDCKDLIAAGPTFSRDKPMSGPELVAFEFYDRLRAANVITYDGILWFTLEALKSWDEPLWPWSDLFVDEFQDCSPLDAQLYRAMPFPSRTMVGDPDQCQPSGTMVRMFNGQDKPIETLKVGDCVVSYGRHDKRLVRKRRVSETAKRAFSGWLYTVTAGGKSTATTGNHRWLVKWASAKERNTELYCVYLMRKGNWFRVGKTRLFRSSGAINENVIGLVTRMNQEKADEGWILSVHPDHRTALDREQIIAATYGIPQACFSQGLGFNSVPNRRLKAIQCLNNHGRELTYPLLSRNAVKTRRTVQELHACNLLDGVMSVPVCNSTMVPAWKPLVVNRRWFRGQVYSLDVAVDHKYVADGLVTCNSIYGFRGASVAAILQFANVEGATVRPLTGNYRCRHEICQLANLLISRNRKRIPKLSVAVNNGGDVAAWFNLPTDEHEYGEIAKQLRELPAGQTAAVLLRTNFLADHVATVLEGHGVSVAVRHKAPLPDDWFKARKLVALLADPANDFLAYSFLLATQGRRDAEAAKLRALSKFETINAITLQLCPVKYLHDVCPILARKGISRASVALVERAARNMPDGATVSDLTVELRSDQLAIVQEEDKPVTVTTLHGAKGREFDRVYISAVDADLLPLPSGDLEEERRLLFVGITRARDRVVLSTARMRRAQKWQRSPETAKPSPFFADMNWTVGKV